MSEGEQRGKTSTMGTGVMAVSLLVVTGVVVGGYFGFRNRDRTTDAAVTTPVGGAPTTQPGGRISRGTPQGAKPTAAESKPDLELMKSALSVQQALRVQVALYRLMHRDELPDLVTRGWEQLLRRTRPDGTVADDGACGPYIQQRPVNPLNKLTFVAAVNGGQKDELPSAAAGSPGAGFLFEPATGRLWLTDAGGVRALDELAAERALREARKPAPAATARESEPSPQGKRAALASRLQALRSQIELYKLQHNDSPPDLVRHPGWAQLLKATRADGTPDPKGKFGPYLQGPQTNPLNGSAAVMVVERMPAVGTKARGGKVAGYFYERSTGMVAATDEHGALLRD
jgi:hypothetical protein